MSNHIKEIAMSQRKTRIIDEDEVEKFKQQEPSEIHYHKDEKGFLVKCYHNGKTLLLDWRFWLGLTIGYPLEHFLWEYVWPFRLITDLFQMIH